MKTIFKKSVYPKNRMKVLFVPKSGTEAVTLFVYCKVGSRNEEQSINGASHFLEHLMFKGTKRRPSTLLISQELESLGAEFNAFTGKDHTAYYIKLHHRHFEQALDIMSDMLFESVFDPKEIERERKVIIEEIKMYEENPMMHIDDLLEQAAFEGFALGRSVAGPAATIAKMTRQQLLGYKSRWYQPANMTVVVAGKLSRNVTTMVQKYFMRLTNEHKKFREDKEAVMRGHNVKIQLKQTEQTQLAFAFPGFGYNHKDLTTLEVLSTILGGSMSSRLFIHVRERKGLCYYIKSSAVSYSDTGALTIQTGVSSKRVEEAVKAIFQECKLIREKKVSQEELERAKEYMRGRLVLQMEASERLAQWFAQEALFMKVIKKPEDRIRELDRVTTKDIQRVAKEIFVFSKLSAASIGPLTKTILARLLPVA